MGCPFTLKVRRGLFSRSNISPRAQLATLSLLLRRECFLPRLECCLPRPCFYAFFSCSSSRLLRHGHSSVFPPAHFYPTAPIPFFRWVLVTFLLRPTLAAWRFLEASVWAWFHFLKNQKPPPRPRCTASPSLALAFHFPSLLVVSHTRPASIRCSHPRFSHPIRRCPPSSSPSKSSFGSGSSPMRLIRPANSTLRMYCGRDGLGAVTSM